MQRTSYLGQLSSHRPLSGLIDRLPVLASKGSSENSRGRHNGGRMEKVVQAGAVTSPVRFVQAKQHHLLIS